MASSEPSERPRKGRRIARRIGIGVLAVAAVLLLAAGGGYVWLRQSLPKVEGTIEVAGLEGPVTVVRDRWAIPHIEAESHLDAIFAQGFVHAQDRLWQMEFQRRLGAGRLAEILGEGALPLDRFMRTLGFHRLAEASLAHMAPETIAWLEAYARGVNAFLDTRRGPLPPEFLILGHGEMEPWTPADSVVWIKMMAMNLSANWRDELLRAQLATRLSRAEIDEFWPDYPDAAPTTLAELARELPANELAAILPPGPGITPGSNAWVIDGGRSRTGAPLLANDPHLGLRAPGTWYLSHLKSPQLELIGATLPGVPGIVLGHNGHLAWGFTTTGSDTQDLFIERLNPDDPKRYLTPDGSAAFEVREETIEVAGGEPVTLDVRTTRHGPVLSDLLPEAAAAAGADQVLALAWPALEEDDLSIQALFRLTRARDQESFVEALRDVGAPQQNVLFADTDGHIGLYAPGWVPIRKNGDGRWPVPGWTGEYDWTGWIPFEDLPHALDPADGALFNANNRVVGDDYPYLITTYWEASHRARRIEELLPEADDLDAFAAMQADQLSMLARDFLPRLLEVEPGDERAGEVTARLAAWDHVMRPDAPEPLIFSAWYRELERLIYADELGPLFDGSSRIRPEFVEHVLSERPGWCDDVETEPVETCAKIIARALALGLDGLEARFGADPEGWRWGEAHFAWMAHPLFKTQPLLGWLFDIVVPTGGDPTSLDVGHYAVYAHEHPFASTHAASYRGLFDLADLERSRFVAATGQSGHPLSAHYRDLTRLWRRGASVPMARQPEAYAADAVGTLVLRPLSPAGRARRRGGRLTACGVSPHGARGGWKPLIVLAAR